MNTTAAIRPCNGFPGNNTSRAPLRNRWPDAITFASGGISGPERAGRKYTIDSHPSGAEHHFAMPGAMKSPAAPHLERGHTHTHPHTHTRSIAQRLLASPAPRTQDPRSHCRIIVVVAKYALLV